MNQKKKNQTLSIKKLKHVKSEDTLPFGSLMQEIGQLKEELKSIKRTKKEDLQAKSLIVEAIKSNKQNKDREMAEPIDAQCINREYKLKMELQLNKYRRALSSNEMQRIGKSVNQIMSLFNLQIKQIKEDRNSLKNDLQELQLIHSTQQKESQQKYRILSRNNKKLESQLLELRNHVLLIISDKQTIDEDKNNQFQQKKAMVQELKFQLEEALKNNVELQNIAEEWEMQCRGLQQKCCSFQKNVQRKSQQLILMHQDIKYLRLQSQKFKNQKRQIQKLWQKSNQDFRQTRRVLQEEIQRIEREKTKWMNECSLRRHESEQIQAIESHRQMLFKQIQQLRNNYSLKCKQLAQLKSILHQSQKKIISIQSQNFKLLQEREKLLRQNQYWQAQIQKLKDEVEEFGAIKPRKIVDRKRKDIPVINQDQKKLREQKLKALDSIHSLIRQHKEQIDQNQ